MSKRNFSPADIIPSDQLNVKEGKEDVSKLCISQLVWMKTHDEQRFNHHLDFCWCQNSLIKQLFPYFVGEQLPPPIFCHSARSIRDFWRMGSKQQVER
eukprot:12066028-Ditylum_brightwellii.AAC.1